MVLGVRQSCLLWVPHFETERKRDEKDKEGDQRQEKEVDPGKKDSGSKASDDLAEQLLKRNDPW
jgi:hypothetical protein